LKLLLPSARLRAEGLGGDGRFYQIPLTQPSPPKETEGFAVRTPICPLYKRPPRMKPETPPLQPPPHHSHNYKTLPTSNTQRNRHQRPIQNRPDHPVQSKLDQRWHEPCP
jgi:hypothetical protein